MKPDLEFTRQRLNELHAEVFGIGKPKLESALAFFCYSKILNDYFNLGTDYSQHPRNPFFLCTLHN